VEKMMLLTLSDFASQVAHFLRDGYCNIKEQLRLFLPSQRLNRHFHQRLPL